MRAYVFASADMKVREPHGCLFSASTTWIPGAEPRSPA